MAYATSAPPVVVSPSRDGSTPAVWAYTSTDAVDTVTGASYFSNAKNLGMRVGDFVLIADSDNAYAPVMATVASVSSGAATVTAASGQTMSAGAGITGGTGTVYEAGIERSGGVVKTTIMVDLTGLNSQATDGDIIGVDGTSDVCHIGQITAAKNGTVLAGTVTCLEVPAGGDPNVDLYAADEGTGVEDGAIGALTETQLLDAAGDWTLALTKALGAMPAADQYLYLTQGDATGTNGTYTAGKFLIELYGY